MNPSGTTRINKLIAHATGLSRREVDNAISAGRITVNGHAAIMGTQVHESDDVRMDGKQINAQQTYTYIMLNKPVGHLSSRRSQGGDPTIYTLLDPQYRSLKPVGRLDRDSSGLLLLTDDGDFAHTMTHPKFSKLKIYEVTLDTELAPLHQQMINDHGISLDDGESKLTLERLSDTNRNEWKVMMSEGRNRQIRRTFSALGYTVTRLHRTDFGPYRLDDLKPGAYSQVNRRNI